MHVKCVLFCFRVLTDKKTSLFFLMDAFNFQVLKRPLIICIKFIVATSVSQLQFFGPTVFVIPNLLYHAYSLVVLNFVLLYDSVCIMFLL